MAVIRSIRPFDWDQLKQLGRDQAACLLVWVDEQQSRATRGRDVWVAPNIPWGMRHLADCPHYKEGEGLEVGRATPHPDCSPDCFTRNPTVMERTHVGRTVDIRERDTFDTDWVRSAVVLEEDGNVSDITYFYSRDMYDPESSNGSATIDATPEVRAEYDAIIEEREAKARAAREEQAQQDARASCYHPALHAPAIVARGRKVPVGTRGTVRRLVDGRYGMRALLVDDDGAEHWTASSNLERLLPFQPTEHTNWVELLHELRTQDALARRDLPRNTRVRLSDGTEGKVFWARDGRIGVDVGEPEPVWTNAYQVTVIDNP